MLVIVIVITFLVQSLYSAEMNRIVHNNRGPIRANQLQNAFFQSKQRHNVRNFASNKNDVCNEALFVTPNPQYNFDRILGRNRRKITTTHHKTATKKPKESGDPIWSKWSKWSSCSVTCGQGREIRWRNCEKHCQDLAAEMEEKTCQLPACKHKLFGLLKI